MRTRHGGLHRDYVVDVDAGIDGAQAGEGSDQQSRAISSTSASAISVTTAIRERGCGACRCPRPLFPSA